LAKNGRYYTRKVERSRNRSCWLVHYDPEISNSILRGIPLGKGKAMEDVEEIMDRIEDLVSRQSDMSS
jgi:hypothetical protein